MTQTLAALAAAQHGVFTRAQALGVGYSADEIITLSRRTWRRLRRGVYVDAATYAAAGPEQRHLFEAHALHLRLRPYGVSSHVSAAVLHRLALHRQDLTLLHVTRPGALASRREALVHHHAATLEPVDRTLIDGLAVTGLARTAVDVARMSTFPAGVVTADAALRAGASSEDLRRVMEACATWPGARTASRAVAFADGRAESPGESLVRVIMAEAGLPQPEPQAVLHDRTGRFVARVDFLIESHRTVVEFDGKVKYRVSEGADTVRAGEIVWAEKQREDRIRRLGYEVERVVWPDLFAPRITADRIWAACARGAARLSRPA